MKKSEIAFWFLILFGLIVTAYAINTDQRQYYYIARYCNEDKSYCVSVENEIVPDEEVLYISIGKIKYADKSLDLVSTGFERR